MPVLILPRFSRGNADLAKIDDVQCDISVMLGETAVPIHQLLRMGRGAIIELSATEDDEVTILANNLPVAKGTVVVEGSAIAVSVTRLLTRPATHR
jgi:flagellar motor switch protein FliN/FliY